MDLGRAESIDTLVRRREAADRRLSSSLRQADLVESALSALGQQMADIGVTDVDESLRASARALLSVAYTRDGYDAWLVPQPG